MNKSNLYLVSTPIGNYEDITLRALSLLKEVDFVICEEVKPARRLLSQFKIDKELYTLNEHNEKDSAPIVIGLMESGKSAALISDAGTPLFSDPGHYLVELAIQKNINVVPIPGANSILPALITSGLDIEKFYYYGWISPKKEIRKSELKRLRSIRELIVIMETPYRLQKLLLEICNVFGKNQYVVLAYKLTMEQEKIYRGKVKEILDIATKKELKGEFVLLINNR